MCEASSPTSDSAWRRCFAHFTRSSCWHWTGDEESMRNKPFEAWAHCWGCGGLFHEKFLCVLKWPQTGSCVLVNQILWKLWCSSLSSRLAFAQLLVHPSVHPSKVVGLALKLLDPSQLLSRLVPLLPTHPLSAGGWSSVLNQLSSQSGNKNDSNTYRHSC